MSLLFVVLAAK